MNGHIKLHRALTEWGWYKDLPTCKLWLHVLLRANYKDCEWQGIEIPRGVFATSYAALSSESGLSVQQVRTALGKLKKTGEITVETNRHYTVITVCKYDEYQSTERDEATTPAKRPPKSKSKPKTQEADKKLDLTERFSEPVCSAVQEGAQGCIRANWPQKPSHDDREPRKAARRTGSSRGYPAEYVARLEGYHLGQNRRQAEETQSGCADV